MDVTTLGFNKEFGRAESLSVVIGGSACVNVGVPGVNVGEDKGTAAIFLVIYLNGG